MKKKEIDATSMIDFENMDETTKRQIFNDAGLFNGGNCEFTAGISTRESDREMRIVNDNGKHS